MLFFTPDWHEADLSDEETDEVFAAYEQYLEKLWPRLHPTVRVLAGELNLSDALVRRVVLDRASRELRLELRCGDPESGFFDLDVTYLGAVVDHSDVVRFAEAARDPDTELLYHEIAVYGDEDAASEEDDGMLGSDYDPAGDYGEEEAEPPVADEYVHRLLFWPYRECEVLFRALAVRIAPRANGQVPVVQDRFVEVGRSAA